MAITSTQFTTRFAWNISADVGAGSTTDSNATAQHTLSFNVTAPGGYRLEPRPLPTPHTDHLAAV